jgi:urease beta subunit
MRLDIPSGTAVRFEPGDRKPVTLVEFGGARRPGGMSGLVDGPASDSQVREQAMTRAVDRGFALEAGA